MCNYSQFGTLNVNISNKILNRNAICYNNLRLFASSFLQSYYLSYVRFLRVKLRIPARKSGGNYALTGNDLRWCVGALVQLQDVRRGGGLRLGVTVFREQVGATLRRRSIWMG